MKNKILQIIKTALKEDIGSGDITTKLLIPAKKRIKAVISAREGGIVCGLSVAELVFKTVDGNIRFRAKIREGKRVNKDDLLARIEGKAASILKAERVALNFLSHLSGVATLTDKFVQRVKPYRVKIMDTRKTTPGLRVLEKCAVRCGGGFNHRMGLWDQVLVKDNHLRVRSSEFRVHSLKELIDKIKRKRPRGMKIEVEVSNLNQFKQVLKADPDMIMLDNMSTKDIRKAVIIRDKLRTTNSQLRTKLEVSGGVSLSNVRQIAACGVEMISVGKLTHSAPALDLTLNCE